MMSLFVWSHNVFQGVWCHFLSSSMFVWGLFPGRSGPRRVAVWPRRGMVLCLPPHPPCEQNDTWLWKHYLPATWLADGNKKLFCWWLKWFKNVVCFVFQIRYRCRTSCVIPRPRPRWSRVSYRARRTAWSGTGPSGAPVSRISANYPAAKWA